MPLGAPCAETSNTFVAPTKILRSCGISKNVLSFSAKLQCIQTSKSQRLLANNHLANGKLLENLWFKSEWKLATLSQKKFGAAMATMYFYCLSNLVLNIWYQKKKTHVCYPAQALAHHKGSPNQTGIQGQPGEEVCATPSRLKTAE